MDHTNKIYNLLSHAETELFGKAYILGSVRLVLIYNFFFSPTIQGESAYYNNICLCLRLDFCDWLLTIVLEY